ncbi:MAG: RIP metalloprotease RseP [Lachnospiraceae bacterium]|nr:RIP metalloprotease RseP [Lachnospiraceae bacterium]
MSIVLAIIVFSVLVLFHEFGHFIMAKAVGIGVTEFSLGMGPRIFSFGKGETKYSLKAIPFGGSCAMVGEDEENPAENAFGNKSVWARFLVVAAGPLFNILLAFIIALFLVGFGGINRPVIYNVLSGSSAEKAGIKAWDDTLVSINGKKIKLGRGLMVYEMLHPLDGSPVEVVYSDKAGELHTVTLDTKVSGYRIGISYMANDEPAALSEVSEGSPAEEAGLKAGDIILSINGSAFASGKEMQEWLSAHPLDGTALNIRARRGSEEFDTVLTPVSFDSADLGFSAYYVYDDWSGNIGELLKYSFYEVGYWLSYTYMTLKMLFGGQVGLRDLSGPVGIVSTIGTVVESGMETGGIKEAILNLLTMMTLLSVNLGVMNLLPIPALDGGRLIFIIYEMIFRKPVPQKYEAMVHLTGFILLMLLMVLILFSDVLRLFGR